MNIWIRVIVLPVVSMFLFIGIAIGVDSWQFRDGSETGTAEIISLRQESRIKEDASGRSITIISYYPTIRYASSQGNYYEAETAEALLKPLPEIGDRVPIRYTTGSKAQVRLDHGALRDLLIAGALIATSLFFFVAVLIFTRRKIPEI